MRKLLAGILLAALPALASAQFCPSCIQNSGANQNATFNLTQGATIQGTLSVGRLSVSTISVSTAIAGVFIGSGNFVTDLNASQLLFGTVSTSVVSGQYFGITGVGALSTGTWNGNIIGTQYGGTGLNTVAVGAGSILYFNGTGTMATLSGGTPEALLQTNGTGAPVWTSSPAVSGQNIYGINPFQLAGGSLPTNVLVSSNSISYVNAASVYGAFGPQVSFSSFTGTIQLSQLSTGTLPSSVVASSITGTGISKGVYGDSSHTLQISFGTDGRASTITVMNMSVPLADLQSGTLASGILVPAANVQAGVLGGSVVASSVAASGVAPGTYGGPSSIPQFTVAGDGRITSISAISFSGPISGTGTTGFDAIWSSTYQLTGGLLLEKLSNVYVSTGTGIYMYGVGGQLVSQSSVTAAYLLGNGAAITAITASNISAGTAGISISGTAALATGIAGGLIGQTPYQTAAGITAFLPSKGALGIEVGNGAGVLPSTATLTGTANQVIITPSASAVTFSLPQSINSGASPTFAGLTVNGTETVTGNAFSVGGSTLVVSGGNVGIGTTSPATPIHIYAANSSPSLSSDNGNLTADTSDDNELQVGGYSGSPYGMWLQVKDHTNNGNSYPFIINPLGGNVGIGTTSPGTLLQVGSGTTVVYVCTGGTSTPIFYGTSAGNITACSAVGGTLSATPISF